MTKTLLAVALQKRVNAILHALKVPTVRYKLAFVLRLTGSVIFLAGIIYALSVPKETLLDDNFLISYTLFGGGLMLLIMGQVDRKMQEQFEAELNEIRNQAKP